AKGEKFVTLGNTVLDAVVAAGATTPEEGLAAPSTRSGTDQTVEQLIGNEAAVLGEKIVLRRLAVVKGDKFAIYLHKTNKDLPPQVGVVVGYSGDDAETARSIAQHISFADPQYLTRDEVPTADVEAERRIVEEISRNEGKPEAALPKIIEGRVNAFFKQVVLPEQDYARDNKQTISKVLSGAGLTIQGFVRFKVGA
ncbi:MAG: elongation factor Ts, partial [Actinomycetota bacterium]|nr:elongation factor Ts [Actinomycetota bacterium]